MTPLQVLLVEDNADLADEVAFNLRAEGMTVALAADAPTMDHCLARERFDVVVLDLGLPGEDGLSVARRLANRPDLRLLMLTARSGRQDRLDGFEAGADVYLTKPVDFQELATVIRRLARRLPPPPAQWTVDTARSCLLLPNRKTLELTSQELSFFEMLQQAPEHLLAKEALETALWGCSDPSTNRRLEVLVYRLREKIQNLIDPAPSPLRTLRLRGYQFAERLYRQP